MTRNRDALLCMAVALTVIVAANVVASVVQSRAHVAEALAKRPDRGEEPDSQIEMPGGGAPGHLAGPAPQPESIPEPSLLVVGASYGRRGIQPQVYDDVLFGGERRTARWWCEATSPVTWNVVMRDSANMPAGVRHVVLLVSPLALKYPSPFKEIALRHVIPADALGDVVRTGQLSDAADMFLSRLSPLYQSRRGAREVMLDPVLRALGSGESEELPPRMDAEWTGWETDLLELAALEELCRWISARGAGVTVAEWPMSSRLPGSVHAGVEEHFRPLMAELARNVGAEWLPQPVGARWDFADTTHPDARQGHDVSAAIAGAMRAARNGKGS